MAESRTFEIRLAASEAGKQKSLSIAELGVLLTGINRAINKAVATRAGVDLAYFPVAQEPAIVRSEVLHVENGSIVLTIASTVSDFIENNVLQATFLAGVFGNAAWDFTKLLGKETVRALRRVGTSVRLEDEYVRADPTLDNEAPPFAAIPRERAATDETSDASSEGEPPQAHIAKRTTYTIAVYEDGMRVVEVSFSSESREK